MLSCILCLEKTIILGMQTNFNLFIQFSLNICSHYKSEGKDFGSNEQFNTWTSKNAVLKEGFEGIWEPF